jgi:hypothetical protein
VDHFPFPFQVDRFLQERLPIDENVKEKAKKWKRAVTQAMEGIKKEELRREA